MSRIIYFLILDNVLATGVDEAKGGNIMHRIASLPCNNVIKCRILSEMATREARPKALLPALNGVSTAAATPALNPPGILRQEHWHGVADSLLNT